ncbi:MAG: SRPBCC family protein [Myxococcota bacterium]
MQSCQPLTLDDFDRLKDSFRFETILDAPPERVFEVFEDPDSWPVWAGAITKVTWTSPKPFEVGTTRDVDIVGGLTVHERFFIWEPNRKMAFYFEGTNKPAVVSLGEYYELEPLPNGRSRFVWRFAFEPRPFMRLFSPLMRPLVRLVTSRIVKGLEKYVRELPPVAEPATVEARPTAAG